MKNLTGNNDNYTWTFKPTVTYNIASTTASAGLSGSNRKVFDGSGVTTAQINHGGSIEVTFTYPGSTDSSMYKLQDGDYTWNTSDHNAPKNVGIYTITLTDSGSATFEIIAKPISGVTISDNDQSKTYDGQAAGLDLDALSISGTDTVSGTALSDTGIQASDFDWYYASGNKLDEVPNGEMNNKLNAGLHGQNSPIGESGPISPTSDEQAIGPKSAIFNHTTNSKNENAKKNELPQTGSAHEGPLAWLGSLFAGLSLFGLAADRKRKKKDDK